MTEGMLRRIFNHQWDLAQKFNEIETRNLGLPHTIPLDLNTYQGQAVLRLFITYFIEELWEMMEAESTEKQIEEAADALHYMVEICLMAAVGPAMIYEQRKEPVGFTITHEIGQLLYSLRKRPAKQKPVQVNVNLIRAHCVTLFRTFMEFMEYHAFTKEQLIDGYFKKAKVNHERIASGL